MSLITKFHDVKGKERIFFDADKNLDIFDQCKNNEVINIGVHIKFKILKMALWMPNKTVKVPNRQTFLKISN